ncbi:hypothetical protein T439DRAFT_297289 [Meredithblackwellia eburnea MCA 4105]
MSNTTSKINPEHVLLMEQATLKAPVELLRKVQKVTQKTYEYNLGPSSALQKDLNDLLRKSAASASLPLAPESQADMLKTVDSMLNKMRGLKRKLSELSNQSDAATHVARTRCNYLATIPDSIEASSYTPWARQRLSHQLADYFLRATPPLKVTATTLAKEEGIQELVDFELWDELAKAETGLREGRLDEVLSWVGENRSALRKAKSPLEFTIHLQTFIELCRSGSLDAAINYNKKHLAPFMAAEAGNGVQTAEFHRACALVAFPPTTTCKVYQELYSPNRWSSLLTLFRQTFLSLHSLPPLPLLHLSLQAGLASLKTPICCPHQSTDLMSPGGFAGATNQPSPDCPLCSSPLKKLAPEVPYSHHANSTIVCGITGKVVEGGGGEGGQLVAMISKATGEARVYSREGLIQLEGQHPDHKLVEPISGEVFTWDELKKVFIS